MLLSLIFNGRNEMSAVTSTLAQNGRMTHSLEKASVSDLSSLGCPKYQFISIKSSSPHFSKVEEVFKSQIEPLYGNQDEAIRKIKDRTDRRCEILLYNDNPVGFVVYKKEKQREYEREGLVDSFEVKSLVIIEPSDRTREAYGAMLVNRVTKLAQRNFAKNLHITVSERDQKMAEFLKSKGFSVGKTWKDKYIKGVKEYLLSFSVPEKSAMVNVAESSPKIEEQEVVGKRKRSCSRERDREFEVQRGEEKPDAPPVKKRETEADYRRMQDQRDYDYRSYDSSYRGRARGRGAPDYSRGRGAPDYSRGRGAFSAEGSRSMSSYSPRKQCHEITLKRQYIHQIKYSGKTIEGRINSGMILRFKTGDQVRFFYNQNPSDDVKCDITDIRKYPSFRAMLQQEGFKKCLTDVRSLEEAVRVYDQIPGYAERAARSGVVAIQLNVSR
jgi:ASC-1-like (ASCH) protein